MSLIKIPFENLKLVNEKYIRDFTEISHKLISSGWYILGENVLEFENEFAKINGVKYCIGVASGLDALVLGLSVFNFPTGSKVLVPSNAYIACILAVIQAGLIPVLVEPNEETCNIDVNGIQKSYTNDCVAVLAVHMYGRLCPMNEILEFTQLKKIKLIEDCAQSHFAEIDNKKAGSFGDIGAFSFYPTKNLGALGDAGAIICNSEEIYKKIQALRNYGSEVKYYNRYIGWNSRLDELQAAFLKRKLIDFQLVINKKTQIALLYLKELNNIPDLRLPSFEDKNHVWHIFNIRCKKRNELKKYLEQHGIGTEIHYPIAPCNQEAYRDIFKNQSFPISERIHSETLSLPISTFLEMDDIRKIVYLIKKFFSR